LAMADDGLTVAQTAVPCSKLVLPSIPQVILPQPALLLAGGFGGPLVVGGLTPLRNSCTLAAHDTTSTAMQIMGRVFSSGFRSGWTGARSPAAASVIQFTMLGPGYHFYLGLLGNRKPALVAVALTETLVMYGATTRNAQLIHNQAAASRDRVPVRPIMPVGPGFTAILLRNCLAMAGIRVFSDPIARTLQWISGADASSKCSPGVNMGGDFLASILCGALSMPFNQTYNFQVTSAACLAGTPAERFALALRFLKSQYLMSTASGSVRVRQTMLRDALLRSSYIGCLFCCYSSLERLALHMSNQRE